MGLLPKQQTEIYRNLEKWGLDSKSLTRTNKCDLSLLGIVQEILDLEEKGDAQCSKKPQRSHQK